MRASRIAAAVTGAVVLVGVAGLAGTTAGTSAISPTAVLIHPDEIYAAAVSTGPTGTDPS